MEFHRSPFIFQCVWVFFVIIQCHRCLCCVDEERIALLEIKGSLRSTDELSTWVKDKTSDHCAWEGIKCSDTTGCVSQLSLDRVFMEFYEITGNNSIGNNSTGQTLLNSSLFLPFKDLQHLDISHNGFNGWKSHQGIENLSKLKKLRVLNLKGNDFYNNILESLSELTTLKSIYLDFNNIGQRLSSSEISQGIEKLANLRKLDFLSLQYNDLESNILASLGKLTSLKTLYLGNNYIGSGPSPEIQGFKKFSKLKKLQFLDIQWNNLFDGNIFASLGELTSLQNLNLHHNNLEMGSSIEISRGFCNLKKLWGMDLSYNNLQGKIPPCLVNFTSLRILDLSYNQFNGTIPPSLTSSMKFLRWLDFSENQLTGSISPSLLFNLTSLHHVSFNDNQLQGTSLITSSLDQNFQLKKLGLSNCNLDTSTTHLKFLHRQSDLRSVDLSHNNLQGQFPLWLVTNNTQLKIMVLKNNSLSGDIHFPLHGLTNLEWIDISSNHIEGHLQTNLGRVLQGVQYLNISQNHLEGSIPTSLGNMQNLLYLDLSNNNFTGETPESLHNLSLSSLILSNNKLHGHICPNCFNCEILRLNNNQFTRFLPNNNSNNNKNKKWWSLTTLDVSRNNISGRIPSWIANLTDVSTLVMRDNSFHGSIPLELCNLASLEFLDLSQNGLSGNLPSCLNLTSLHYMHFEGNKLSGSLPPAILRSPNLQTLNLNHNNFSGTIPSWFGLIQNLGVLLLKENNLSGFVPYKMCKLNNIWILDLSHNGFSGKLPACLSNLTFGKSGGTAHASVDTSRFKYLLDYSSFPGKEYYESYIPDSYVSQEEVEFMTKGLSNLYMGDILNYMSGMDLSCNNFSGHIPLELGALTEIHALNLSHNQFTGPIPKTLSQLKQLESMDLSHNKLSGEIPSELTDLNYLSTFIVAYNNLSGRVPDKQQFSTFGESSYEGNPYLCGPPLQKQRTSTAAPTGTATTTDAALSDIFGVDPISFLASCGGAYIMSLLALVVVLYINPYWRRLWFDSIDAFLSFVFPFWSEAIYRVPNPFT